MERQLHSSEIDRLVDEGVALYESGQVDQAIAVWSEVLHLHPEDPRALELLRSAGVDEELIHPASALRIRLEQLLAQRKYEEALDFLHTARWETPDAPEISRGIHLLKERLIRRYLHKIGDLDAVPRAVRRADEPGATLNEEERHLLRLVDGISTFGDIAHESRLGRFETYRALAHFVGDGTLVVDAAPVKLEAPMTTAPVPAPVVTPAPTLPPPPRRARWIPAAAALTVVALAVAAATWWTGRSDETPIAAATVPEARPAPPPPSAVVEPLPVEPAPAAVEPDAAAPPPAPEVEVEPPPVPEIVPPARERGRRATAKPRAVTPPPAPAEPPPIPVEAATPVAPPPVEAAPPPPPPPPEPEKPKPQPAPAPPPPPKLIAAAAVTVTALTVDGSLVKSPVERAVQRVVPAFRTCYAGAAKAAGHDAAGSVKVRLVIDETGRARDVSAGDAPLPRLAACLQDAAIQVRSQVAPDVGVAAVAFTVVFTPGTP